MEWLRLCLVYWTRNLTGSGCKLEGFIMNKCVINKGYFTKTTEFASIPKNLDPYFEIFKKISALPNPTICNMFKAPKIRNSAAICSAFLLSSESLVLCHSLNESSPNISVLLLTMILNIWLL